MRKITSLMALLFAFVVTAMAQSGGYPINFDKDANATRANDRPLNAISLTAAGAEKQSLTVNPAKAYNDLTTGTKFTCEPGATLKAEFAYAGIWMHGYVYLDADNDGEFSFDASTNNQAGKDLVSYSFYGPTSENYGYNSAEKYISGDARSTVDCPEFKAPEVAGEYRMRFKIDWNNVDAGGCVDASNHILNNGGYIVDAILVVEGAVEPETPAVPDAVLAETYNGKVSMEFFGSLYELNAKIVFGKDENGAAKEGYATLKIWETENFNVEVAECVPYEVSGNTVVLKGVTVGAGDGSVDTKNIDLTFTVNEDGNLSCSEKVYGPTPDTAILQFDFAAGVFTPEAVVVEPVTFVKSTPAAGSTVETLSVFSMTFNKELASVDPEMMMMLYGGMNPIPSTVQINGTDAKTITVTLQEPYSLAGGYIYYIAAGSLVAADGSVNEEDIMLEYNIEAAPNSFGNVYATPASGSTVESLVNVRMGFMGEVASVSKEAINVVDGNGTTVTTATLATDDFDPNAVELTLAQEITAGGTYKIVVPENYIVSTSGTYNPELTLTYTIEGEEVSEEVLALIAKAEAALEKVGVGYPSEASNGRNNLVAAVANVKETASQENVDALNAALNAYYGETNIALPENGKAYTFTMVAKNGNKFYLNYTGSDIAMVAVTGEELPASAKFFATENSNGTFSFQTNDGKYLVYHSKYAGVNWLQGGSTTGLQDELSDMTDITLQKMVNGNKVEAVDNEQIFGLVAWYSKRGYDTGKGQDAMGYMVLKTDGSDYDGADAPFWNMNYSSAFLVEEAQVALNTLNPESVEPAEPAWWDSMEDIENVTINFPEEITYNEEKPVVVMFNDTDNVEVTVAANAKQLVVTFPANLKIGEYVVNVPEGAVVAANGTYNPALKYTYNVDYAYNTFEPTSITPAAGEVESLKTIVLDFGPNDWPGTNGLDLNTVIELTNASGEVVATGKLSYSGYTGAAVTLDKEITALGLYTLVIPEGSIWNSKYESTEEKGVYKGARCNPTIELTYSIGTAATVTEVSPAPGHYEEIPADIAVTFSKEIGYVKYLILRNNNTGMRGYYFAEDEYTVEGNRLSFTLPADMISYAAGATVQIQVMDKDGFPVTYAASEDDLAEGYVMLVYTAPVRANIFSATKVDPKEGEVTELSVFNVTFESLKSSEGMSYVGGFDETKVVEVLDAEGNQVATATMEVVNNVYREEWEGEVYEYEYPSSVAKFTLDKTITAAGTYTLVIPEATVFNEGFYPDSEDFGIGWGALYNPETRFVYTIKDPSAISGVEVEAANGKVYNLQGVRVANKLQKGVYIVNGKKVYVK